MKLSYFLDFWNRMQEVDFRHQYLLLFCYCFATRGWSIWSKRNFPLGNLLYWNFHSYNLNRHGIFCHETHNEVVEFSLREFSVMEYFIFHGIFFFPESRYFLSWNSWVLELSFREFSVMEYFFHGIHFFLEFHIFMKFSNSWKIFFMKFVFMEFSSWNFLSFKKSHGKFLQSIKHSYLAYYPRTPHLIMQKIEFESVE